MANCDCLSKLPRRSDTCHFHSHFISQSKTQAAPNIRGLGRAILPCAQENRVFLMTNPSAHHTAEPLLVGTACPGQAGRGCVWEGGLEGHLAKPHMGECLGCSHSTGINPEDSRS